ncbi:hypothetical protein FF1_018465 [Malus domestica]
MYQPSHLASLVPTMQSFTESATQKFDLFKEDEEITFSNLSLWLATDVIGQAAFGVNFGLSKPQSISESIDKIDSKDNNDDDQIFYFVNQHFYSTTQLKMDLSGLEKNSQDNDWKVECTNRKLSGRLDEIVVKRMKDSERGSKDFLSLIMNVRESEVVAKNVITQYYISAVAYEHLLAGSATTSFTMSSIVYLVAGHPDVEKKLLAELDGFGPRDQMPTAPGLLNSKLVINEAMRFCWVSPLVARKHLERSKSEAIFYQKYCSTFPM